MGRLNERGLRRVFKEEGSKPICRQSLRYYDKESLMTSDNGGAVTPHRAWQAGTGSFFLFFFFFWMHGCGIVSVL